PFKRHFKKIEYIDHRTFVKQVMYFLKRPYPNVVLGCCVLSLKITKFKPKNTIYTNNDDSAFFV
ncbi:MAG: hypothetical protein MJB12_18790, partial [Firmicutes bacterium]|nr:hypothetical protein [Bacillota bacterium]